MVIIMKKYLSSAAMLLALSLTLSSPAFAVYNPTEKNTVSDYAVETPIDENITPFSDDRYDLPLTTWNCGTIKFEHTMETTSNRPYYKVWVRNSGSYTMYVDIGNSKNNAVKAGETKEFYGKSGIFSRNQDIIVTCKDGYSLYGQIAIKISDTSLEKN